MPTPFADLAPIERITDAATRASRTAREFGLDRRVARLGRWTVRDVIAHLGGVHRWAARVVATASMGGPSHTKSTLDGSDLLDWFDEGARSLIATLAGADPDASCPNFNPGSTATAEFWIRRQLHETVVHAWDIEAASAAGTAIDTDVAVDGIDECLDVWVRPRGKQTLTGPLTLRTSTSEGTLRAWTLHPAARPGRVDINPGTSSQAAAELSGPADELYLVLWNRRDITHTALTVTGKPGVVDSFRRLT